MDTCIIGANLLVAMDFFPATIMLIIAMVICMNVQLKEVISLPRGQYVPLLTTWAFLVLEIFHAIAVILSLDLWLLGLLHLLQDIIRGNCLPGEGLICHLFVETARHLATLIAASILVSVLTVEEDFARSIVPETRQALEALEDWWDSKHSSTSTADADTSISMTNSLSPCRNTIPSAQSAARIGSTSKKLSSSNEQPERSNSKLRPKTSTYKGPNLLSPKGSLIKKSFLVPSASSNVQPQSSDKILKLTSSTSMVSRHHKGTIRGSSLMDSTSRNEETKTAGSKLKPATRTSATLRPKAAKVSLSSKPPTYIAPPPSNEQPGFSGGNVTPIPSNSTAKRKPAIKGASIEKKIGQDNNTLAQKKSGQAKKK